MGQWREAQCKLRRIRETRAAQALARAGDTQSAVDTLAIKCSLGNTGQLAKHAEQGFALADRN